MSYETALVFNFIREGKQHEFKFNIRGESLKDIQEKAKTLRNEIWTVIYEGKPTIMNPVKFEVGNEILIT
jgi:hypothetical protein